MSASGPDASPPGCGNAYPVSPCPPTHTTVVPPPHDPHTADTGANLAEPVATLGLFLALGAAAIWSAHKRKGKA